VVGVPQHQVLRKAGATYSRLVRDAKNRGRSLWKDWTLVKVPSVHTRSRDLIRHRLHMSVDCHHTAVYISGRHQTACQRGVIAPWTCATDSSHRPRRCGGAWLISRPRCQCFPRLQRVPVQVPPWSSQVRNVDVEGKVRRPRCGSLRWGAARRCRCRAGVPKHCRPTRGCQFLSPTYLPGLHRHTSMSTVHVAGTMRRVRHRYNHCHVTDHVCSTTAAKSKILFHPRLTHHDTGPQ
jgi:hypothetical protein